MTNGQDVLTEIVLSKLRTDSMSIEEMLLTARDLPKTSEVYTPLDNAIEKFVLEHISDMDFVEKCNFFDKVPIEVKARTILDKAMLEDAELFNMFDVMYFYNRAPDRSKTKIFLEDIVIEKQIPKMTFDKKRWIWHFNPTERVKDCLDESMLKDISAELKEVFPAFFMEELEPNERGVCREDFLDSFEDSEKILDLWRKAPDESKARTILEEAISVMNHGVRRKIWNGIKE